MPDESSNPMDRMERLLLHMVELTNARHKQDMDQSRERHQLNNDSSRAFLTAIERVTENNEQLVRLVGNMHEIDRRTTALEHTLHGPRGGRGLQFEVENNTNTLRSQQRLIWMGHGGIAVLLVALKFLPI